MSEVRKSKNVPLNEAELAKLSKAAMLETVEAGAIITPTALFRTLAMAGVEQILAQSDTQRSAE